jgi:hypothetical protein
MSYQISITGKESYILIELLGEIPIEKLFAINAYLYRDPEFINHPYAIWDVTECIIDTDIIKVLAYAKKVGSERNFDTPGKTAFITNDQLAIDLVQPFVELVDDLAFQLEAFENAISAVKWITE